MTRPKALAIVAEIIAALGDHATLPCTPVIEEDDGQWTLTVTFHAFSETQALDVLELAATLTQVQSVAQMRGLADTLQIPAAQLEAVLAERGIVVAPPSCARPLTDADLTGDELARVIAVLTASADPDDDELIDPAIEKLRALQEAERES